MLGLGSASRTTTVKQMRRCKKEVLCLIQTFVKKSNNPKFIAEKFIPPLLEPIRFREDFCGTATLSATWIGAVSASATNRRAESALRVTMST